MQFVTDVSREQHIADAMREDHSACGRVRVRGIEYEYCVYKGSLAWVTLCDKEINNAALVDEIFVGWLVRFS